MPLHLTTLKVGSTVILLRNMDYPGGLCNGTRLIIVKLGRYTIQGKILTGKHRGETAFIPRISLDTAPSARLPFTLRRRQFPVRLAFTRAINKAQGQSLKVVGIIYTLPFLRMVSSTLQYLERQIVDRSTSLSLGLMEF